MYDDIGDRMKAYETVETARRFDPSLPVYARLDGRSFHSFTKGLKRPFDSKMHRAMIETACALVEGTHARIGYTQSDEISLVWQAEKQDSQIFFDGKIMKMASVLAGLASAHFALAIRHIGFDIALQEMAPCFDCRVLQLPSRTEAANMFLWRELDASKNAVSMAARAHYSAKELYLKSSAGMLAMLADKGIKFDFHYPDWARRGSFVRRVVTSRMLAPDELARIPERHRPASDTLVERSSVMRIGMPSFCNVANREEVIFDGADPVAAERRVSPEKLAALS